MTVPEQILGLFAEPVLREIGLIGLADRIIALATETPTLRFECVLPTAAEPDASRTFEIADSVSSIRTTDIAVVRLFRPLMARLANMAREENGVEFDPYGGQICFFRNTPTGTVRLDVDFSNTLGRLHLRITCVPISADMILPMNGTTHPAPASEAATA